MSVGDLRGNYKLLTQAAHTITLKGSPLLFYRSIKMIDLRSFRVKIFFYFGLISRSIQSKLFLADTNNGVSAETFNGLYLRNKIA